MELITNSLLCFSLACSVLFLCFLFKSFSSKRTTLPLPPGTLGLPYIGETFQLYSQDPNVFFASKQKRFVPLLPTLSIIKHLIFLSYEL